MQMKRYFLLILFTGLVTVASSCKKEAAEQVEVMFDVRVPEMSAARQCWA